jgi:hypothetical protein
MFEVVLPLGVMALMLVAIQSILDLISYWIRVRLVHAALARGVTDVDRLIGALHPVPPSRRLTIYGAITAAVGVAFLLGAPTEDAGQAGDLIQVGLVPLCIGAALLGVDLFRRRFSRSA